ncbi:hypothetical protein NQ317_013253 [Molorchus minor]|uniref:Bromo domain-containing protein n=1 Tax=Molorchus minor TaxID=1323400 RepID=A0ABQ9K0B9_9CUCU|nr:hypothetical protein NQ317_013253 [Molorchus minor]
MQLLQSGKVSEEQLDKWCKEIDEEEHKREQETLAHAQWLKERGFSPSQVQNVSTSPSILHTAITTRHIPNISTNPTIASLLNTSTDVTVSPGLQQLVSTAIGQEVNMVIEEQQPLGAGILDDANLQNIKIEDLANSILVQDGPLPEIKKEEVDDIISEIIEGAHDIVSDPEQHLQLDGNGDININLELEDFEDEEVPAVQPQEPEPVKEVPEIVEKTIASQPPVVDPFEFQEDPQQPPPQPPPVLQTENEKEVVPREPELKGNKEIKTEPIEEQAKSEKSGVPGSVEIVEVVVMDDEDIDKELNKTQIQDIVHSTKPEESVKEEIKTEKVEPEEVKPKPEVDDQEEKKEIVPFEDIPDASNTTKDTKKDVDINLEIQDSDETTTIAPSFSEEIYEDLNMEVKVDKTGKIKRDYSRTRKKEGFDMLLAIEKAQLEDSELTEETFSDNNTTDTEKKDIKQKIKSENDRSNSPWTEEEDNAHRSKRRYSTPATPVDSVPNSPASSTTAYYEDDRDYRNWKKSVMLVYNRLATNKYASLFLKPITEDQAPGYNSVVYRPMDLLTIKKNIENGTIRTTLEFKRDTMLMFQNAIMYNKTNGTIYNMALQMQQESLQPIEILMQAQSQADMPLRRETRTSESSCKRKRTITDETISPFPKSIKKRKED